MDTSLVDGPYSAFEDSLSQDQEAPQKKIKLSKHSLPETEETKNLSTQELQRLVLLEQLKLTRLQIEEIENRRKSTNTIISETETGKTYTCI